MKLQILVSDELTERIDKLAKYVGVSRSSICCTIIAKALPEWEELHYSDNTSSDTHIEYEQLKIQ